MPDLRRLMVNAGSCLAVVALRVPDLVAMGVLGLAVLFTVPWLVSVAIVAVTNPEMRTRDNLVVAAKHVWRMLDRVFTAAFIAGFVVLLIQAVILVAAARGWIPNVPIM